jgi:hypothetical protein
LFDNASNLGSFSQVSSIDENVFDGYAGGQPQLSHPQFGHDVQQGFGGHEISVG